MNSRIVAVVLCVAMGHGSVAAAAGPAKPGVEARSFDASRLRSSEGPLQKASRDTSRLNLRDERGTAERRAQTTDRDDRPWMQRHPVWTGALIGFAAVYGLAMLTGEDGIVGRHAPALLFGGIGAGVGALAGWGWSRDDDNATR